MQKHTPRIPKPTSETSREMQRLTGWLARLIALLQPQEGAYSSAGSWHIGTEASQQVLQDKHACVSMRSCPPMAQFASLPCCLHLGAC